MVERQLAFVVNKKNELECHDLELDLPPRPLRWPTAEEFRAAAAKESSPYEQLKELRRRVPLAGPRTLNIPIRRIA